MLGTSLFAQTIIHSQKTTLHNFLQDFLVAQTHIYKIMKKHAKTISPYSQAFTFKSPFCNFSAQTKRDCPGQQLCQTKGESMLCNQLYKQPDISGVLQFFRVYSGTCSRPSQSAFSYFYHILHMQGSQPTYNLHFLSVLPSELRARWCLTSLEPKRF